MIDFKKKLPPINITMKSSNVNLEWMVNGVVKEVILRNVSRPIAVMKKTQLKNSTHTRGLLLIKRI